MRRLLQILMGIMTCAAVATAGCVVATSLASEGAVAPRATTFGEVGHFRFPDTRRAPGAECKYDKQRRLTAIKLRTPRAAGRQRWEPGGQWILWTPRLQTKARQGGWKFVLDHAGRARAWYSEAQEGHTGPLRTLPPTSIPHIFGASNTQYRVVETIYWYTHNTNVEGRASTIVKHYESRGEHADSCDGVAGPRLPSLHLIKNEELDAVNVSFARGSRANVRYSIKSGALPQGLSLMPNRGVVTGRIAASAVNTTVNYHSIQSKTFRFVVAARAHGQTTTKSYRWRVFDTAFVMPDYYGKYGCGYDCDGIPNISSLGQKFAFGCTTEPQPGIPEDRYSVIYRQDYQKADGSLASSTGLTFRYGDVFKWWYYNVSC